MKNKEITLALILVLVGAVATAAAFVGGFDNSASAKSNKAFGKCVSSAKGNNTAKLACNGLKRGHPFNFTESD